MKYFFHMEDGRCIRDVNGEEFPDDAAAMLEATKVARELSKQPIQAVHEWHVVVTNPDGRRIGSMPLVSSPAAHAVAVPPDSLH